MSFSEEDVKEILEIVTAFSNPVKKVLVDFAKEYWSKKWAHMIAENHATYFTTLKDQGLDQEFAMDLTKIRLVNEKFLLNTLGDLSSLLGKKEKTKNV